MPRKTVSPTWLTIAVSLWMATVANFPLWRELQSLGLLSTHTDWLLAFELALVMGALLSALLSLVTWCWTLKPAILILLALSAFASYFMWTYHIVIDSSMVVNVLQTDASEAYALLNARMIVAVLVLAVIPSIAVLRVHVDFKGVALQSLRNAGAVAASLIVVACVIVAAYQPLSSAMRNHKQLRYLMNPLNTVYALGYTASKFLRHDNLALESIGVDAVAPEPVQKPPLLVLVVGETARGANFSVNGYGRDTTPELARESIATFGDVMSCGTNTAVSLPCMFSHLGRNGFGSRSRNSENLLDVLQRAGLAVLWLDNQSGCKGVCDRMPSASTVGSTGSRLCHHEECFDAVLLEGLDARLAALPAKRRARGMVVVMHQMGSHGPAYYRRSPAAFKRFFPECTSNDFQGCTSAELSNAYDNSIAYTDHVLASTIAWLKARQNLYTPAMVYVSDHGESLGEHNIYLHGLPYAIAPESQKRVPWITWMGPEFAQRTGVTLACLRSHSEQPLTHDNYFHSILGLMQIRTRVYRRDRDVYAQCTPAYSQTQPGI